MRRTPLKRGGRLLRRVPLRNRSLKRMRAMVHRRRLVAELLEARPWCEVGISRICDGRAVDVHELLSRARGGDILDPTGVVTACRTCHDFVTSHPAEATASGWLLSAPPRSKGRMK